MQTLLVKSWYLLTHRSFLWLLLITNILGTVYGYYWYGWQLVITDPKFLIFVPDSPTASLFFCFVLFAWLLGRNWKLMEALALITLVKYGVWAVVMNLLTFVETDSINPLAWMLIASHFAMALQAILYMPKYRFTMGHVAIAAIWTLHNDIIDYVFEQMPIYGDLLQYMNEIGYFTFWLSICCIGIAIWNIKKRGLFARFLKSSYN